MSTEASSTRIPQPKSVTSYLMRELMGILSLIAVAAFDIGSSSPDPAERVPLIVLHILFFVCFLSADLINQWMPVNGHIPLVIFAILQGLLIWFGSNPTTQIMLLFVQSAYAHEALPEFPANLWILAYGLASMIGFSLLTQNPVMGSLIGVGALGGFAFIGAAARNRRAAEAARAESQRLLQELQVAHEQLQRHALESETLAAAEERNRVARELHDTLGHRLTVAAVQLEGAQRIVHRDPNKAAHIIGIVRGQVLDGLTELRQTVAALRSPIETDIALAAAITLLANQFATATGLQVHLQISDDLQPHLDQLSRNARHTLFRAAQEALTNIHKHAYATSAWIKLDRIQQTPATIQLEVHDNGVGMQEQSGLGKAYRDESAGVSKGFGLAGLAERATQLQGTMHLTASPHGGCALIVTLPIESRFAIHASTHA